MPPHRLLVALLLLGGLLAAPPSARAAESYDGCDGYIDSLPATISTQGVWCMTKNLSSKHTQGSVIMIRANNVTIDCNGFKIGGLAAGTNANTWAIYSLRNQNVTVRRCTIRGFNRGIELNGGGGHLVEDNRFDNNLEYGMIVGGKNSRVYRNAVYDTGGQSGNTNAYGIRASGDIIGNTVSGLFADRPGGVLIGISSASGSQVRDNTISGFDMTAVQGGNVDHGYGIMVNGDMQRMSGNHVSGGNGNIDGTGIKRHATAVTTFCMDNTVIGFDTPIDNGCISIDNVTY